MAYCGPRGIPLSEFLSWDPFDQQAALDWQAHENSKCPDCRVSRDVVDPARGGHPHALVPVEDRCPTCAALERFAKRPDRGGHGVKTRLVPNPHLAGLTGEE